METININGRTCHIKINGAELPTIYWGEMKNSSETIEKVLALCEDLKCNYAVYEVEDWNADFSPWEFTLNKKMSFSGGGSSTLDWLVNECVPYCEKEYSLTGKRVLCGYSLAGLFSLWAFYESQAFRGVISCSGSLWFGDWISYAESRIAPQNSSVYLSLGKREEKARDRIMATVDDCTRRQYELVCGDKNVFRHVLEWNDGGHFNEPEKRIAKGIKWLIE
ncbi:alpha/beta hydrolase [Ruminococcus sp.]